jgi:hypothetical protein
MSELLAFARSVKVSACRVKNTPNLIFLCGGPPQDTRSPARFRSVRDYFFRYIKTKSPAIASKVRLAEDIGRWLDHGFTDLLEVEEYVAAFADLIILFVESPGSIAELGAFSALATVQPKLLAVLNKKFSEPSFISDGPARRLQQLAGSSLYKYLWNPSAPHLNDQANLEVFKDLSEEIFEILQSRQRTLQKERSLDLTSHGHAMLMVADLIDIVFVATITDVQDCLRILGREIDRSTLQKYLFLLTDLKIIEEEYLDGSFYVSGGREPYIAYDFLPGSAMKDRGGAKVLIRKGLEGTRARILRRILKQRWSQAENSEDGNKNV